MPLKWVVGLLVLMCTGNLCAQSELDRAQKIYDWMLAAQGDSILTLMNDEVRAAVSGPMLGATFGQLQAQLGQLESVSDWEQSQVGGITVYYRDLTFALAPIRFLLAFDADGRANTIRFVPADHPTAPKSSEPDAKPSTNSPQVVLK